MEIELPKPLLPPDFADQIDLIRIKTMNDCNHLFLDKRNQPTQALHAHRME